MIRTILAIWMAAVSLVQGHGDLHGSIGEITRKIQLQPMDANLHLQRALLYAADGDSALAETDFGRAEALGADPSVTSPGLAKVFLNSGRPAEACLVLEGLLRREPGHAPARIIRARARAALHQFAGAAADYQTAIRDSTQPDPELYLEWSQILAKLPSSQNGPAILCLEEGISRLGPGVITLQLAALELETNARQFDAALTRIQRISASAPRKEIWQARRADLLALAGKPAESRQAYSEVLSSIAALPPGVRSARATTTLEAHARRSLARFDLPSMGK